MDCSLATKIPWRRNISIFFWFVSAKYCYLLVIVLSTITAVEFSFHGTSFDCNDYSCLDCGKKLSGSLDGLFQIYQAAVIGESIFKVSAEDSLHLVEALRYYGFITTLLKHWKRFFCFTICLITFAARLLQNFLQNMRRKPSKLCACQPLLLCRQVSYKLTLVSHLNFFYCFWKNSNIFGQSAGDS